MSALTIHPAPMGALDLADLAADTVAESDICAELARELGRARRMLAETREVGTKREIEFAEGIVDALRADLVAESGVLREAARYGGAR